MAIPIVATDPLIGQQGVESMGFVGEGPFHSKVLAEADNENAVPLLFVANVVITSKVRTTR